MVGECGRSGREGERWCGGDVGEVGGRGRGGAEAMAMIVLAVILVTAGIFVRVGKKRNALSVDSLWDMIVLKGNGWRH